MDWPSIYDRESKALLTHLLAHGCSRERAEDILQDVFLAAIRTGTVPARPRAYLFRAARNALSRDSGSSEPDGGVLEIVSPARESDVDAAAINAALARLPVEQREVVVLRIWHGLGFREIGEALGIVTDTAASRWRHGIAKLKRDLRESEVRE